MSPPTTAQPAQTSNMQWTWAPQPRAFSLVQELVNDFLAHCRPAAKLAEQMKGACGTRFIDWVDHIRVPHAVAHEMHLAGRMIDSGFNRVLVHGAEDCFINDKGIFPNILLTYDKTVNVAIKVDSVADFLAVWQVPHGHVLRGEPGAPLRMAQAFIAPASATSPGGELWAVERHGYRGYEVERFDAALAARSAKHLENFRRRQRKWENDADGFAHAAALADAAISDLGRDWTCDLFFQSEREYWQRRNRAAQVQKARQDKLGLGWANHDHHTYRSGRGVYHHLIAMLEKLGFHCRERFYAGAEAGWGAQVLEQSIAGITIFADVDMTPEELMGDFAHQGLPPQDKLGTIGLWCALHGEAFLQAGMHHLECMFDWHALKAQLETEAHIKTMDPFTTFPYLRQAFTEGERWAVDARRVDALLDKHQITKKQAEEFKKRGAVGSHLENLERNDGFKGFNQHGVSQIISKTDPRKLMEEELEKVGA